jgi:hypothetical protein
LPGLETSDYTVGNGDGMGAAGSLTAGYLMPGQLGSNPEGPRKDPPTAAIENWQENTVYDVGQSTAYGDDRGSFIIPTDRALAGIILECTTTGTTETGSGNEPAWPTTIGTETTSGTAVFTTRAARVLPRMARQAAWMMASMIDQENRGNMCDGKQWSRVKHMLVKSCL